MFCRGPGPCMPSPGYARVCVYYIVKVRHQKKNNVLHKGEVLFTTSEEKWHTIYVFCNVKQTRTNGQSRWNNFKG